MANPIEMGNTKEAIAGKAARDRRVPRPVRQGLRQRRDYHRQDRQGHRRAFRQCALRPVQEGRQESDDAGAGPRYVRVHRQGEVRPKRRRSFRNKCGASVCVCQAPQADRLRQPIRVRTDKPACSSCGVTCGLGGGTRLRQLGRVYVDSTMVYLQRSKKGHSNDYRQHAPNPT